MMQAWIIGDLRAMVIIAYAVVIFAIITLFKGVRIVPQGFEWTVERFGRYDRTLMPGLGLTVPWVEAVGRKLNMMEQEIGRASCRERVCQVRVDLGGRRIIKKKIDQRYSRQIKIAMMITHKHLR